MEDFEGFQKIARFYRHVVITEKIDGTNAQIFVGEDGTVRAGSRTRWITPDDDNYGFARWVAEHADDLRNLGPGRHFGEWWGRGIQRNYSQPGKRFSLFNVARWGDERPACCDVVPTLFSGTFTTGCVPSALAQLRKGGSVAAPGFTRPEGIVIWHDASRQLFKVTLEKDEAPKSVSQQMELA
jgi:hypothetical protein